MRNLVAGVNDLYTKNKALAAQWHPTRNGALTPHNVMAGSGKRVWWMGDCNHEWDATISNRAAGSGCPVCRGFRILVGFNDLRTKNPDLAKQLHPTLNGSLTAKDFTGKSNKTVWWICAFFHEWKAKISERAKGNGCPKCYSRKGGPGRPGRSLSDLLVEQPNLVGQWHPTLNGILTTQNFTGKFSDEIWWICDLGHEWKATLSHRAAGNGCGGCSGRKLIAGVNDLFTTNRALAEQWHPTKNGELTARDVKAGSKKKVWWICPLLHHWEAEIKGRSNGRGCPICSGKVILIGFNDLLTVDPGLASQWHPQKNGNLTPKNVTKWSGQRVWWICVLGHVWETAVSDRSAGRGCSKCSVAVTESAFRDAFEQFSGLSFGSNIIDLFRLSRKRDKAQIDMINDDLNLVIEYDGAWTHGENALYKATLEKKLANDKETTEALVKDGYNVVRIRNHDESQKLPFISLDPECEPSVFQITYKSFGKDKDDIEELVQRVIKEKSDWFKVSSGLMLAA